MTDKECYQSVAAGSTCVGTGNLLTAYTTCKDVDAYKVPECDDLVAAATPGTETSVTINFTKTKRACILKLTEDNSYFSLTTYDPETKVY